MLFFDFLTFWSLGVLDYVTLGRLDFGSLGLWDFWIVSIDRFLFADNSSCCFF